jgi:hypothetical protein
VAVGEVVGFIRVILGFIAIGSRWVALRDRNFGLVDCLVCWALTGGALALALACWDALSSHGDPYARLLPLLGLLALLPLCAGMLVVAVSFLVLGLIQLKSVRIAVLGGAALALLAQGLGGWGAIKSDLVDRGATRQEGAEWALESGAAQREDCERHSKSSSFRDGCTEQLRRMGSGNPMQDRARERFERVERGPG